MKLKFIMSFEGTEKSSKNFRGCFGKMHNYIVYCFEQGIEDGDYTMEDIKNIIPELWQVVAWSNNVTSFRECYGLVREYNDILFGFNEHLSGIILDVISGKGGF